MRPHIDIIEQFTRARAADFRCEDVIAITDDHAAVIDGAGDPSGLRVGDERAGHFAAHVLVGAVAELERETDLDRAADVLTERLRTATHDALGSTVGPTRPTASALLWSAARREVWRIGSGTVRFAGRSMAYKPPIEELRTQTRVAYLQAAIRLGQDDIEDRERRGDRPYDVLAGVQHAFQNDAQHELGYGVLDGTQVPGRFLERWRVPDDCKELVLASDGYPVVLPSLEETESALAQSLERDPLRLHDHPETKAVAAGAGSFDDRAYLRVRT